MRDRVGLGWRPELAAAILSHLDRIDLVEVIADGYFGSGSRDGRALRTLAREVAVALHGVTLGLASTDCADRPRLDAMARLVGTIEPEFWSEHLAFVRGGGIEIGHLAAPPRNAATIEGTARNVAQARSIVGSLPLLENVATLIDPPGSDRDEPTWIADTLGATDAGVLLDLHNLYANAVNFGFDVREALARIPLERVGMVHLAGGRWITGPAEARRLLDDHLHDVPSPVFGLLEIVAARTSQPLIVVIERDGRYPPIEHLLGEVDEARARVRAGRARRSTNADVLVA